MKLVSCDTPIRLIPYLPDLDGLETVGDGYSTARCDTSGKE